MRAGLGGRDLALAIFWTFSTVQPSQSRFHFKLVAPTRHFTQRSSQLRTARDTQSTQSHPTVHHNMDDLFDVFEDGPQQHAAPPKKSKKRQANGDVKSPVAEDTVMSDAPAEASGAENGTEQ